MTHILGVRAFGTQLLCEQVVGRGLRRVNYDSDDNGMFEAEYADVLGVPFTFVASHAIAAPKPPRPVTRIHACPEREAVEIRFPRVVGYRVTLPSYPDASGPECTVLDQAGRLDAAPTARAVKLGTALAA